MKRNLKRAKEAKRWAARAFRRLHSTNDPFWQGSLEYWAKSVKEWQELAR